MTEKFQKDSVFKQMGNIWRSAKSRTVRLVRAIGSKEQLINLKPNNINSVTAWMNWVKMKKGKEFKVCVCIQLYFKYVNLTILFCFEGH